MTRKQIKEWVTIAAILPFILMTIALDWLSELFWDLSQAIENVAKKINNKINPE